MSLELVLVIACGFLALIFGGWLISSLLSKSAGTPEMQAIAAAIQEGARAYLNRQYTTIALVGLVVFGLAMWLFTWQAAVGYVPQQVYLSDGSIADNIAFAVAPKLKSG